MFSASRRCDGRHSRVYMKLKSLASNPRPQGVKKLQGARDLWRIRVGENRVIYAKLKSLAANPRRPE